MSNEYDKRKVQELINAGKLDEARNWADNNVTRYEGLADEWRDIERDIAFAAINSEAEI